MCRILICVLCSILFVTTSIGIFVADSEVRDCFYINNNTESIQLVCDGFNVSYPKSDCFSLFSNASDEIKIIKTGNCEYVWQVEGRLYFMELRELDISYCGMSRMYLHHDHLEILNASHNEISYLRNTKFPSSLRELDLSFNYIKSFYDNLIDHLTELRIVNLSNNDINSIGDDPFKYNRKLEILRLENNPIMSFDCNLQSTIKSASVYLTLNYAWKINTACLGDSLQIDLDSKDDVIFRVPQSKSELRCSKEHFNKLVHLNIAGNALGNAPQVIESLGPWLQTLDVSSNSLATLNMWVFDRLISLKKLVLTNAIDTTNCLGIFQRFSTDKSSRLETFYLEKCPIKRIDCHLFSSMKDSLTVQVSCDQVEEVDTSCMGNALEIDLRLNNRLVFRLPEKKSELRCSENGLDNIKRLNVSGNEIKIGTQERKIDCKTFAILSSYSRFNVSWNRVKEIDTSCFGRSLAVNVSAKNEIVFRIANHNQELRLTKETFNELTYLNISGNQLENVAEILQHLGPSIETLDLASNRIGALDEQTFNKFVNLTSLNLSRTNLLEFEYRAFTQTQKMNSLDLSYNQLKKVNFTFSFGNLSELTFLNLEGNNLTEIDSVTPTTFPKLSTLGISSNNLSCDYLATFMPKWNHSQFINNPSNQNHVFGVHCHYYTFSAAAVETLTRVDRTLSNFVSRQLHRIFWGG